MIIIIISLTTNFIAVLHGLYLLAAQSHSFQFFLFSFRVEHVEKSLWTMSNRMCYPLGKKDIAYRTQHDSTPVKNYRKCCYVTESLFMKRLSFMKCTKFQKPGISYFTSLSRKKKADIFFHGKRP